MVRVVLPGNKCPHCDKKIVISASMTTPRIDWILRQEDVDALKDRIRKHLNEVDVQGEDRKQLEEWLNSPDTVVSPDEIEAIKDHISEGHETKEPAA